jgi:hypothetical protein
MRSRRLGRRDGSSGESLEASGAVDRIAGIVAAAAWTSTGSASGRVGGTVVYVTIDRGLDLLASAQPGGLARTGA